MIEMKLTKKAQVTLDQAFDKLTAQGYVGPARTTLAVPMTVAGEEAMRSPMTSGRLLTGDASAEDMCRAVWLQTEKSKDNLRKIGRERIWQWQWRIHTLVVLLWDYIDTVQDLTKHKRIKELKKLTREMKEAQTDYWRQLRDLYRKEGERLVAKGIAASAYEWQRDMIAMLDKSAQAFEDANGELFDRLFNGLEAELRGSHWKQSYREILIAVMQARTVLDVLEKLGDHIDREVLAAGVIARKHAALPPVAWVGECLRAFAGNGWWESKAREMSANALYWALMHRTIKLEMHGVCDWTKA